MKREELLKKAVALTYDSNRQGAPVVAAKGWGYIADTIIKLAQENNIPLVEDKDLVRILDKVDVQTEIPEQAFRVVAELYAFLYRLNKNRGGI